LRKKDAARHAELRKAVAAARKGRRSALSRISDLCASLRADLRKRARALRVEAAEHRASARALDEERRTLGAECAAKKTSERAAHGRKVEAAAKELAEKREELRRSRVLARPAPGLRPLGKTRAQERRQESDEAVEGQIPSELVPLWRKVKLGIRSGPRMSRAEAFLRWVEENPSAQWELAEQEAAADLRRLEREAREHARSVRARGRYGSSAGMLAQGAAFEPEDDLPF
jgi:hypothetical protein